MIKKTVQEPIVSYEWYQFDGTIESAKELYRLLTIEKDGIVFYPAFHFNDSRGGVLIDRVYLRKGEFFEIGEHDGANSEIGPHKYLIPVARLAMPEDYFEKLITIKEEKIEFGR